MSTFREQSFNSLLSTIASLIAVLTVVWLIIEPALVKSVSEAVAEDVEDQIEEQAAPLQNAFKVILRAEIADIKESIAMLEFREEHEPNTWLAEHAKLLVKRKIELVAFEEAYAEL